MEISEKDLNDLKDELDYLITTRRPEIIALIEHARSLGDLSENSEYDEAREEQGKMESRIEELKEIIKNAVVLTEDQLSSNAINIGTRVKIFNRKTNKEVDYEIVSPTAADASNHRISNESPIGAALIGANVGDVVIAQTPKGSVEIEILAASKAE